jgi:hypothetical protein
VVGKRYEWPDEAKLEEHSRRKHKIVSEYVSDSLTLRCKPPQQERFAIVDGFAGGGRYQCGTLGSPLIFIEQLKRAIEALRPRVQRRQSRCDRALENSRRTDASGGQPSLPKVAPARRNFKRVLRGCLFEDQTHAGAGSVSERHPQSQPNVGIVTSSETPSSTSCIPSGG